MSLPLPADFARVCYLAGGWYPLHCLTQQHANVRCCTPEERAYGDRLLRKLHPELYGNPRKRPVVRVAPLRTGQG
jgi:hypothetical protein